MNPSNTINKELDRQISGKNEKGEHILSVITKRTFSINDDGTCQLHDVQQPLIEDQSCYTHNEDLLEFDADLFPYKLFTDIIIKGKARNFDNRKQFDICVSLDNYNSVIHVTGNRKPYLSNNKKIIFSDVEPVHEVPLRYDFAYGGCDTELEKQIQLPPDEYIKALPAGMDLNADSPYRYPRNPCGKGYIIELNENMIDELELPFLEDPEQLITGDNILVKNPENWFQMPLPRCTDWVNPTWFPRLAYFGLFEFGNIPSHTLKEVKYKWAEQDVGVKKPFGKSFNMRCTNGASLGFQMPFTPISRQCRLLNIHPKIQNFVFKLPDVYPKIWIDGRKGKLLETRTVVHTILIEPDERRLSIVWSGSGKAIRPYLQQELDTMPFNIKWNK